jgi:hypothetical protein
MGKGLEGELTNSHFTLIEINVGPKLEKRRHTTESQRGQKWKKWWGGHGRQVPISTH